MTSAARPYLMVRVNGLQTGLTDADLDAIAPAKPDAIMLPKAEGGASVIHADAKLAVREATNGLPDGHIKILPIATETAAALFVAGTFAGASARLIGLTWGAEDLSAELGAQANRDAQGSFLDPYRLARVLCLAGAAAATVPAIDTVYVDFRNSEGFRRECEEACRDGFVGKMAIHPAQVPIINEVFTPSAEAIDTRASDRRCLRRQSRRRRRRHRRRDVRPPASRRAPSNCWRALVSILPRASGDDSGRAYRRLRLANADSIRCGSSVAKARTKQSMPAAIAASAGRFSHSRISAFCCRTACAPAAKSAVAMVSTSASSASGATTRSTRPQDSAVAASMVSPSMSSRRAPADADQPRNEGRLHHRRNADLDLGHGEFGPARSNPQVAGHRHFQARAQRVAVDARDHRHRQAAQAIAGAVHQRDKVLGAAAIERGHFRNTGAADERLVAGAGEYQRAQLLARGERVDRGDEFGHQRAVERA